MNSADWRILKQKAISYDTVTSELDFPGAGDLQPQGNYSGNTKTSNINQLSLR